jgi:hypothetical protein
MNEKYFSYGDVLGYGWRTMKSNLGFFVGVGIISFVISYIPTFIIKITEHIDSKSDFILVQIITNILSWIINVIIGIGMVKIALSFCDEQKPTVETLFDAWDCFWRYLGAALLTMLICMCGFILFIIPGIIWSVKFSLFPYFVVEQGLGPVEALKASSQTTNGIKWELLGFYILCGLINLLGVLCLFIGIFATYPTTIVATALVYRQLLSQTPELNESDISTSTNLPSSGNSESSLQ